MDVRSSSRFAPCALLRARESVGAFVGALFLACLCLLHPLRLSAQSSICAEVKIEIDQKVSLERQAFDALLRIRNGLDGVQVERLDVNLVFKRMDESEASSLFYNRLDTVDGITGSVEDGSGTVAALTTGEAHWLIIPSPGAGGTAAGENYQIGATVTYRMTGDTTDRTVEVIPEIITVRPQPLLDLDYFLPGYVYADDPLTEPVEPVVPFTLGVRIANSGYGPAQHTTIESAQPQIVQNDQGLLIGFQIEGSYVDDLPSQPSLLIDFGDIEPGQSRMGRWLMTTTLSGQFFDFDAEYTHADDLGGALTSLLGTINKYLLTHDVLVDLPGRDGVLDFLAQAVDAQDTDTYRVYESDGAVSEVVQQFTPTFGGTTLSFPSQEQGLLVYARAPINFDGQSRSISATRVDNQQVVAPANIWFSKRRNASGDGWVYFLNLFEANPSCGGGTCAYSLTYDGAPSEASLSGVVYVDVNANGVQDAGEQGMTGVSVALSGGDGPQSLTTTADGSFQFANLSAGTYALTVASITGYYDGVATIGTSSGTASAASISGITLGAGTQAMGYGFAKVPNPVQRVADLAVTGLTTSASSPRVGETITLTLQIVNAGPDTATVDAGLTLPSTLDVVSANPSVGTFDAVTKHWAVGDLPLSGTATLSLQVRANSEGDASISASVSSSDAAILDPLPANNVSLLVLHVRSATEVSVTPTFAKESRILALVVCPRATGGITTNCQPTRISALATYLAGRSVEHLVLGDPIVFRDELRSGRWNVYWIDNGLSIANESILAEIDLAVLRGGSLIIDGTHTPSSAATEGWAGVSYSGLRPQAPAEAVTFVPNDYLNFSGLVVSGNRYAYQVTTGTVLAKYPDNAPAIVLGMYGQGRVMLFAYDLVTSLTANSAYTPLFDQIATSMQPEIPDFFTADAYVPVQLQLKNLGDPVVVDEVFSVPTGASIIKTSPAPTQTTPHQVTWRNSLAALETFDASAGIRTPNVGVSSLSVDITRVGGANDNLAHQELPLVVKVTNNQFNTVRTELSSLQVSGTTDINLRADALAALDAAAVARTNGQANDALADLLAADALLIQIISADPTAVRVDLGWLLQAFEREWYTMLPPCSATVGPPIVDTGTSFSPYGEHEGFLLHQASTGFAANGFEWDLGADTQSSADSVAATTSLVRNQTYQWTLSYDGIGGGTLTVLNGTTNLASLTYNPASLGADALRSGNALRLYVEALAGTGTEATSITVNPTSLDGSAFSDSISASATTTATNAALYYYGNGLKDGFVLSGTLGIVIPRAASNPPPPRLSFRVNAGSISCEALGR